MSFKLFFIFKFAHVRITQYAPLKLKTDTIKKQSLVCVSVFTLLSKDLCPTVNWTNGLGTLVTFLPDWRIYKCLLTSLPHSNTYQYTISNLTAHTKAKINKQTMCHFKYVTIQNTYLPNNDLKLCLVNISYLLLSRESI